MLEGYAPLVLTGAAFLLAGFVKGVIGMGLPTVAIGVLSLFMAPAQAAALFVAPSLAGNIWQSLAGPALLPLLRRFAWFFVTICIGIWAGAGLLTGADTKYATSALGVSLSLFAAAGLASLEFKTPPQWEPWLSPLVGIVTGLITGATGVFVIPAVPYLQSLEMSRDELIQSLGLSFLIATIVLALVLTRAGFFSLQVAGTSMLAILPALAGMYIGQIVRGRVRPRIFRMCFFIGMLVLGLHLGLRAFF